MQPHVIIIFCYTRAKLVIYIADISMNYNVASDTIGPNNNTCMHTVVIYSIEYLVRSYFFTYFYDIQSFLLRLNSNTKLNHARLYSCSNIN